MKKIIEFEQKQIPVYTDLTGKKALNALNSLIRILEMKIKTGKSTVKKYLKSLDSIEIQGCEAILYSKNSMDTLALSIY
jgi:hypothetical protein